MDTKSYDRCYWRWLTGGRVRAETLVGKSFGFLLAREPNTSILRSFELLPVICRYFPEYETTIKKMLVRARLNTMSKDKYGRPVTVGSRVRILDRLRSFFG